MTGQQPAGPDDQELAPSGWFLIDQDRVNHFADATLDHSWTHVDVEETVRLGGTTAHGMLILSLVPHFLEVYCQLPQGCTQGLNYGFDRVRFTNPVPVGKRIRFHAALLTNEPYGEDWRKKTFAVRVEIEGDPKPALHADWIFVYR